MTAAPAVPGKTTAGEIFLVGIGLFALLALELRIADAYSLFGRYLWFDELQVKLLSSQPGVLHSLFALAYSGDETPPTYYLLARLFWWIIAPFGGTAETSFRVLSFVAMYLCLLFTYAVLRRVTMPLPALFAVLIVWSSHATAEYAFSARPYAVLMAATAAFCLAYATEKTTTLSWAGVALSSILACGIHYFGIVSVGAVVSMDAMFNRQTWSRKFSRLIPVVGGPLLWLCFLPIFRAQIEGYEVRTFLHPLTWKTMLGELRVLFFIPLCAIAALLLIITISKYLAVRERLEKESSISDTPIVPIIGMLGLLIVPLPILAISMKENHFLYRYLITSSLGAAPLVAILTARIAKPLQLSAMLVAAALGTYSIYIIGMEWTNWQVGQDAMIEKTVRFADRLPIVTLTSLEAYFLYEYSPIPRNKLLYLDLLPTHREDLDIATINDATCFRKWRRVVPDAPKIVTLSDLKRIGDFYPVLKTRWSVLTRKPLPFRVAAFGVFRVADVDPDAKGQQKALPKPADPALAQLDLGISE